MCHHQEMAGVFKDVAMKPRHDVEADGHLWCYETKAGLEGGILIVAHLDVPVSQSLNVEPYRRDPERL